MASSKLSPPLHTFSQTHSCDFTLSLSLHSTTTAFYSTTTLGSLYEGLKPPHGFLGWLLGKYRQTVSVLAQATHQKKGIPKYTPFSSLANFFNKLYNSPTNINVNIEPFVSPKNKGFDFFAYMISQSLEISLLSLII